MAEPEGTEVVTAPTPKNGEETMSVSVKGKADDVVRRITGGGDKSATPKPEKDDSEELAKALRNPVNIYSVKRTEPEDWGGVKVRREVHAGECPTTLREIIDFVTKVHGGEKYRISVSNGETNKLITAEKFSVEGPVILPRNQQDVDLERILMTPQKKDPARETAEAIEKQTEVMLKQSEYERAKQAYEDLTGRRADKAGAASSAVELRLAEMERKLIESQANNRVLALEAELRALRAVPPPKDESESPTMKLIFKMLEDSKADRVAADDRMNKILERMQDDKLNTVMAELKAIKEKPAGSSGDLLTQIASLKKIGGLLGWTPDEDDDDDEPKEWWEILIKDSMPRLFDLLDGKKKEGKAMTKEEVVAEMDKMAAEAVAKAEQEKALQTRYQRPNVSPALPAPPAPIQPPAPKPAAPAAPPPSGFVIPEPKVAAPATPAVPAVVSEIPVATPAPEVAPAAPPPPAPKVDEVRLTPEQEVILRCANVMEIFAREMLFRPRSYQWTFLAWEHLPEDYREALSTVTDPAAIPAIFANAIPSEKVAELTKQFENPKVAAFVQRGLTEFKEWCEKLKADPDFDPGAEEDDGEDE